MQRLVGSDGPLTVGENNYKYRCVCTSVLGVDVAYTGSERSHLHNLRFIMYGSNFSTPLNRLPFRITHKQSLLAPTVGWGRRGLERRAVSEFI